MKSTLLIVPKIKNIQIARAYIGYSTVDLAKESNLHYTAIQAIESGGNKTVSPKTAKKISDTLNKKLDELFEVSLDGKEME